MIVVFLFFIELVFLNIQVLFAREISFYEIQPMPIMVFCVFIILKCNEEKLLFPLVLSGVLADIFYSNRIGPVLTVILLSAYFLSGAKNMLFRDHFVTHMIIVFSISLVGSFLIYLFGGKFALRGPLFFALYNALLTPILFYVFQSFSIHKLINQEK